MEEGVSGGVREVPECGKVGDAVPEFQNRTRRCHAGGMGRIAGAAAVFRGCGRGRGEGEGGVVEIG